jgi:hypothetical protein
MWSDLLLEHRIPFFAIAYHAKFRLQQAEQNREQKCQERFLKGIFSKVSRE